MSYWGFPRYGTVTLNTPHSTLHTHTRAQHTHYFLSTLIFFVTHSFFFVHTYCFLSTLPLTHPLGSSLSGGLTNVPTHKIM